MGAWVNTNQFLEKRYHVTEYNCSHFARDVWLEISGSDISDMVVSWNSGKLDEAMRTRQSLRSLEIPEQFCLVLFQKPNEPPHLGVYMENRIFHMTDQGPRFDDYRMLADKYTSHKFYLA